MEQRKFGRTGLQVSALGLGAAEIGFEGAGDEAVAALLGGALEAGCNVIDTAECYGNSEELLGRNLGKKRDRFHIFTKCGHPNGFSAAEDWSKKGLVASIERSLERLKTDRVEVVQLHSCTLDTLKRGDCIEALLEVQKRGLTRFLGYSGDSEAAKWALESGRFDVLQTSVSIADQESLELLLPLAKEKDVGVIAKRPVANVAWKHGEKPPSSEYHRPYWDRLRKLDLDLTRGELAKAVETALRFTLFQDGVHTAIVGTTKASRWQENSAALAKGALPSSEVSKIRARWKAVAKPDWIGQV